MASLDKKYRPKNFNAFVGNEEVVNSLKSHLSNRETFPSSILFKGHSGCGKTTLARIIAKKLKIQEVIELNVADSRGIDDARTIIANLRFAPLVGTGKVIVLNECHEANKNFQDALLEVLEEPPANVHFFLCTTDPQKLLPAVMTRVTPYLVRPLDDDQTKMLLRKVCKREKIKINPRMIKRISQASEGVPRSALLLLNEVKGLKSDEDKKEVIDNWSLDEHPGINKLCQAFLKGAAYKEVMKLAKDITEDPERIRRAILNYMSKVLQNNPNQKAAFIMDNCWESWYWTGKAGLFLSCYHIVKGEE